jgi:hypothetical protein
MQSAYLHAYSIAYIPVLLHTDKGNKSIVYSSVLLVDSIVNSVDGMCDRWNVQFY